MNKIFGYLILSMIFLGCDTEDAPDCFKKAGTITSVVVEVPPFEEIIVYEGVKLFIKQGPVQNVEIETGENLRKNVLVSVENNRLSIRNENSCNLLREYGITKVTVTIPNLTWLQNSSGSAIESIGVLKLEALWLQSVNQARDPAIHTDGDFILELDVENLRITNDNISNYFLSGKAENFNAFFAAGDSRLEAGSLVVQRFDIFHRGTNKMIINPQESLQGEIRSTGDVISKKRPPIVRVEEFYTGKLIFEGP